MTVLLTRARQLGSAAKDYQLGATGPSYYDCSGLVYRAAIDVGVYSGFRFTTFTVHESTQFHRITAAQANVDDIIVWSTPTGGHMGIISGPDRFYSAHSVATGIHESSISGFHSHPVAPFYLRPVRSDGADHSPVTRDLELHTPRMTGIDIRELQEILEIPDDGTFGPQTEAAVKRFQYVHGLAVDGIVGTVTRHALGLDR